MADGTGSSRRRHVATVVRTRADSLGIEANVFAETDVHVHLPEGATPKDGPSAGLALTTALVSAFTDIPIRPDIAMTGETSFTWWCNAHWWLERETSCGTSWWYQTGIYPTGKRA